MSDASPNAPGKSTIQKPLPPSVAGLVLGLTLGAGATFMVMYYFYGPEAQSVYKGPGSNLDGAAAAQSPGPPGGGMGGGGGMMGGGMGGGGMGGGPRGKRNLTSIVGKIDLLSKGLSFQLDSEQSARLAAQLADVDQAEKMTQEEAQERFVAIEAILTDDQKETLAQIDIPRGGRGGAGGGQGGQMAGMGGGGMGGGGMGGGGGGGPDEANPFQQETNQARQRSLLDRLKGVTPETASDAENTASEGSSGQ